MKRFLGLFIIILLVGVIFAPVEIPYTIGSVGKVFPRQQWVLTMGMDEILESSLKDFRTGSVIDYSSYRFERGDVVQIQYNPENDLSGKIEKGALVATISSNKLQERLLQLKNGLAVEKANLQIVKSGQKEEVLMQLSEEVNLAQENLALQKKKLLRAEQLYKEGVISLADFEKIENAWKEAGINVKVAEKKRSVITSGEKKQQIDWIQSKIKSLEEEIAFLIEKQRKYSIYSPISGKLRFETDAAGERLIVEDTSLFFLFIPVKLKDKPYLSDSTEIFLQPIENQGTLKAFILEVNDKIEVLNNEQVVFVTAGISEGAERIAAGLSLKCKLNCGKVTPLEYLKRSLELDFFK